MGGDDMTLGEVAQAGELMLKKAPNTGRIIWGAKVDEALAGHVRVTAVLKMPSTTGMTVGDVAPFSVR